MYYFSKTLPTVRDFGPLLETTEGLTFLKMGVKFASFHIKGTLPEVREKIHEASQ